MNFIAHRINSVKELLEIPTEYGVEVDLRDFGGRIVLQHDPFKDGENFEDYLKQYNHGTMILNIKSERIEHKVLELIQRYNIKDYFFLDSSFPMIYLLSNAGENNIALRFSEFEGIDTLISMQGKINWVWVDCFTKLPIDKETFLKIKNLGYKLCLVSPELQGRPEDIEIFNNQIGERELYFDAICTKIYNIPKWK